MILRSIYAYGEGNGFCGAYNIQKTAKNSNFQPKIYFLSQKLPLNQINGANLDIFWNMHHPSLSQWIFFGISGRNGLLRGPKVPLFILECKILINFDPIFTHEGLPKS